MSLIKGNIYHGFRLQDVNRVEEINSTAFLFEHEKCGARLLFLENDDDNKVFSITFRTPPSDSTGVAHIVEHSVLCGSRKFPVKEPFVELVKGSLNTFLNAMTFPDKTMYPVASRNDKDFRNLMDVYLDAVFYPQMHDHPEILMQEGWHYELEAAEQEITYKGVVYNEMKGVFSSPDAVLDRKTMEVLFPDTTYGNDSGGDPDDIPKLTQEMFSAFHKQYYHPSNSYIFLFGKLDIVDNLKFLDAEYLSGFDRLPVDSEIAIQDPFNKAVEEVFDYPVSPGEGTEDKTMLGMAFVTGLATDRELYLAFQILAHLLLDTPAAPLKKALIDAEVGKEVYGYFTESLLQPTLSIIVSGTNQSAREKFVEVVYHTLQGLVDAGIDKSLLEASINVHEFKLREANFGTRPKGLIYNIRCMDSWLYNDDPLIHLAYERTLKKIKEGLESGYFESLIKQYLLENAHRAIITLQPTPGLGEQRAAEIRQELKEYKSKLTKAEIEEVIKQTVKLKARQEAEDSEEQLAAIPLIKLSDIQAKAEKLPLFEQCEAGVPILTHPQFTNQIAYTNLYFDTGNVPLEQLPYLYLLVEMLGKIDTHKYTYANLANEINLHTGGITYDVAAYPDKDDTNVYTSKFRIKSKTLLNKLPNTLELLGQVAGKNKFDDKKRIRELIQQIKTNWATSLFRRGQQIVASRVLSYFSPAARFNELGQYSFYQFLVDIDRNLNSRLDEIIYNLEQVSDYVFTKNNLLVSFTCDEEAYNQFQNNFSQFTDSLSKKDFPKQGYSFTTDRINEGLMTSGKVQYAAKGANFRKLGYSYHGSLKVLETVLRYDYFWNRIRVQGGAYGAFAQFERTGNLVFGSYRDPNLKETLAVYNETAAYLKRFNVSDREMNKYIIGTMSLLDTPLTPQLKGEKATLQYLRNISHAMIQQERDEILSTERKHISGLAEMVEAAMKENYLCVLGSEEKIKENKELFSKLVSVSE